MKISCKTTVSILACSLISTFARGVIWINNINGDTLYITSSNSASAYGNDTYFTDFVRYFTFPYLGQVSGNTSWNTGTTDNQRGFSDPIQREIYDKMAASGQTFTFSSSSAITQMITMRLQIIAMIGYFSFDHRFTYFSSSISAGPRAGSSAASYWTLTGLLDPNLPFLFTQSSGSQSNAIYSLCLEVGEGNPANAYGDCRGAVMACYFWGAEQALGGDFDSHIISKLDLNPNSWAAQRVAWPVQDSYTGEDPIPGDWVYFPNTPKYNSARKDPTLRPYMPAITFYQGENAIYVGNDKYSGLDWTDKTIYEMKTYLIGNYNADIFDVISFLNDNYDTDTWDGVTYEIYTDPDDINNLDIIPNPFIHARPNVP